MYFVRQQQYFVTLFISLFRKARRNNKFVSTIEKWISATYTKMSKEFIQHAFGNDDIYLDSSLSRQVLLMYFIFISSSASAEISFDTFF